jgi:putative membrane protein insertion efficiency factor
MAAARFIAFPFQVLLRAYQLLISPLLGERCKYHPSCSHYASQAIRQRGLASGSVLALWRLARCNPWSLGGIDHVPASGWQSGSKAPAATDRSAVSG